MAATRSYCETANPPQPLRGITNQTERNQPMKKKTYQQITKGMKMRNWEIRERSDGKRFLYVRYIPKAATNEPSPEEAI